MKLWISNEKGNDKVIAYANHSIYKGNPKEEEIDNIVSSSTILGLPEKGFIEIPFHYLKEIHMEEGKPYIEIFFGNDSTEHLRITDHHRKQEIFDYLRSNIPNSRSSIDAYSIFRAGKKPLIAMIIVLALFLWTFYIANGLDQGLEYDVAGKRYNSVAGIVLALASLGTGKVLLIFGTLFCIALIAFISKTKQRKIVNKITINR